MQKAPQEMIVYKLTSISASSGQRPHRQSGRAVHGDAVGYREDPLMTMGMDRPEKL
jgi:hypothetical protein